VVAAALWVGLVPRPAAAQSDGQLAEKRAKLKRLQEVAESVQAELAATRDRLSETRRKVYRLEREIGSIRRKHRAKQQALADNRARLEELSERRAELKEQVADNRARLARYLRTAARQGQAGPLRALLSQQTPDDMQRALTYLRYLHEARAEQISALRADRRRLAEVAAELRSRQERIARLEKQLARQEQRLEDRLGERRELVAQLREEASSQAERLESLRADQKALKRVIDQLQAEGVEVAVDTAPITRRKGELPLPLEPQRVRGAFGQARGQQGLTWQGVLLEAEAGSEVSAIFRGRVVYADRLRGYGLMLIIDHGNGVLSLYGHNRALYAEVGDWVSQGETVAAVGATGGQSRAGAYFEIRRDGTPTDPFAWCRRR
jgi:septal ring factor EnvC (AmiA/AmiB activator)